MLIYRFRATMDDQDDFLRDIEILPNQSFLDFYEILADTAPFDKEEDVSFFLTDKFYKKQREITLNRMHKEEKFYDDEMGEMVTARRRLPLMKDAKLKDFIEDPHQKMLLIYQSGRYSPVYIEMFKIMQVDDGRFPLCIRSVGKVAKPPVVHPVVQVEPIPAKGEDDLARKLTAAAIAISEPHPDAPENELAEIEGNLHGVMEGIDFSELETTPSPEDTPRGRHHDEDDAEDAFDEDEDTDPDTISDEYVDERDDY